MAPEFETSGRTDQEEEDSMVEHGKHENVKVADIELDKANPRIRRFLEMYGDTITPE